MQGGYFLETCELKGANGVEQPFLESGSDAFIFKPFPFKIEALRGELLRILYEDQPSDSCPCHVGFAPCQNAQRHASRVLKTCVTTVVLQIE
jgi:hypothetical protein